MYRIILGIFLFSLGFLSTAHSRVRCESVFDLRTISSRLEIQEVMDVSRTEKARVYIAKPRTVGEIRNVILLAKKDGLKIAMKGTNHSHGGHNRRIEGRSGPRAIQIDMMGLNKILDFSLSHQEVTVQPGVTWKELSIFLDNYGLAAMTEQSSNIFSIGGSVATNVHGRDIHGPLIQSIKKLKIMDANGIEQTVSRANNPLLFRAIVGGYGAFGVITEVTLHVEKNYLYQARATQDVSISNYVQYIKTLSEGRRDLMHYGRVNLSGNQSFERMSYVEWVPVSESSVPSSWSGWKLKLEEKNRWVSSMIMNLMRYQPTSGMGKYVKDTMDRLFGLPKTGTYKTKNNILNNPVQFLFDNFYNRSQSVDILQEYYLPPEQLEVFLENIKAISQKYNLDLMNVTMRYVPQIPRHQDSLISPYSDKHDQIAVVLYFNISESKNVQNGDLVAYDGGPWTKELIHQAQSLGGTFYWPYHRWWGKDQLTEADRSRLKEFFKLKQNVDPDQLFESDFIVYLQEMSRLTSAN